MIKYFGGLQWDLFEMGGGTAAAYLAAEYFEIDYAALVDAQSEAGLIGGSAGNSAEGYRDVTAVSVEAVFPVTDWLEIDAAVRADSYSDFGDATSPRIGAAMRIPGYEQIALRASWGQGFRAPDMSDLYGLTSFSASSGKDQWGCEQVGQDPCPTRQFDTYIGSNPDLEAEESETFSIGGDWDFMDNWMAGMTYWHLKLTNSIEYTSAQDQLNVDYQSGGNNPAVQRDANGSVLEIAAGFQNGVTDFEKDGLDFFVKGSIETGFGNFLFAMNASKYLSYDYELTYGTGELGDAAGTLGFPEWRSNGYVSWTMDSWNAALSVDYIGESEAKIGDEAYDGWHTINASVGYDIGSYGSIELGASNITDEDPLLDAGGYMVDEYQYPITGRVIYAEYTLEF